MKKIITLVALVLASVTAAHAQFGVIGGFTSSSTDIDTKDFLENAKNVSLYHVGVTYKVDFGGGFALQPALSYQMKGANLKETFDSGTSAVDASKTLETKTGFAELSLGIQWGPDLVAFRPFVFAEPFVGYAVSGDENFKGAVSVGSEGVSLNNDKLNDLVQDAKNKLEYGFGIGLGVDITSHLQISAQYFMNLGNLYDEGEFDKEAALTAVKNSYKDINNYQGVKVSLAIFF